METIKCSDCRKALNNTCYDRNDCVNFSQFEAILRISSAGSCPRKIFYEAWGVEGLPTTESTERAFLDGRIHEPDIIRWACENLPDGPYQHVCAQKEVVIPLPGGSGKIYGHIDGILASTTDDYGVLVEAKCLKRHACQEIRAKGLLEAHPQYYTQVQLYLLALGFADYPIKTGYLVARAKDTPSNRLYDHVFEKVVIDLEFCEEKACELEKLLAKIRAKEVPNTPYDPEKDWNCRPAWCPYTYVCWPDYRKVKVQAIDRSDLLPTVETYQELCEEIKALEGFRDEVKAKLFEEAANGPVRAGSWVVEIKERRSERLDTKTARKILPADMLNQLITVSVSQVLNVKEVI
jgi:YqaJ-like viral recombinase domain.